jgi:hypothetical protein
MITEEERTKVIIFTSCYRITGEIALVKGARLTDYIKSAESFTALTRAEVTDLEGNSVFKASFLDVNRDRIEIIAPS